MVARVILVDSNILIDALRDIGGSVAFLATLDEASISVITHIEVLVGAKTLQAEAGARALLSHFRRIDLTAAIAEQSVIVRRERRLDLPDAVIYATAELHGLRIATRNTKHFKTDDPRVLVPYTLN